MQQPVEENVRNYMYSFTFHEFGPGSSPLFTI